MRAFALVVAASLVLASCAPAPSPGPTSTPSAGVPSAQPSQASSPAASPSPAAEPPQLEWSEISLDPVVFGHAVVGHLFAGGPGVVAFGRDTATRAPVTWTSPDGEQWTRHDQAPWVFGGVVPRAVASGPDGLVAIGAGWGQDVLLGEPWLSTDGARWARSTSPARSLGADVESIAAAPEGLVAFGSWLPGEPPILTSEDGRSWEPLPDPEAALGPDAKVDSVVRWGDGFLATGTIRGGGEGAIWTSADGRTWRPVAPQPSLHVNDWGQGYLGGRLFPVRDGYLLVGARSWLGAGTEGAWTSTDGTTWTLREASSMTASGGSTPLPGNLSRLVEILQLPDVQVGVVNEETSDGMGRRTLALSEDGLAWTTADTPVPLSADLASSAAVVGSRILLMPALPVTSSKPVRAWWAAPQSAPAQPSAPQASAEPPGPQASAESGPVAGPGDAPPAAPDLLWQRLEPRGPVFGNPTTGRLEVEAVVPYRDGLLAVGSSPWDIPGYGGGPPPYSTVAWTSPDGRAWTRAPGQASLKGGAPAGLAVRGPVAVAVGSNFSWDEPARGMSWRTTDGRRWVRAPAQASLARSTLEDVIATPDGFLAVGSISESDPSTGEAVKPMAWTSSDGRTWTRAADVEPSFDPANRMWRAGMRAVVRGGPGYVAVGWGLQHGLAWTSADGQTWSLTPDSSDAGTFGPGGGSLEAGGGLADVAVLPDGLLAVGQTGIETARTALFASTDGSAWERLEVPEEFARTDLRSVATFEGGVVVGGGAYSRDTGYTRAVAFTSPDGRSWTRADPVSVGGGRALDDPDAPRLILDLLGFKDGIIGVGIEQGRGAIWLAGPPSAMLPTTMCPTGTVDLATLDAMSQTDRVACFAGRDLGLRGYATLEESDKGPYVVLHARPGGPGVDIPVLSADDGRDLADWFKTGWNGFTGHFGDAGCRTPGEQSLYIDEIYQSPLRAQLECASVMRVTAVRPAGS